MSNWTGHQTSRTVGVVVIIIAVILAGLIVMSDKLIIQGRRYLILTTVNNRHGLVEGSPVFYKGLQVGKVIMIRPPTDEHPGYKLRMAVDQRAFMHIPLDSPVRIDSGGTGKPWLVNIMPGRTPPDPEYPGKVKVLNEITPMEIKVRAAKDILQGVAEISEAKTREAEVIELEREIDELKKELKKVKEAESAK